MWIYAIAIDVVLMMAEIAHTASSSSCRVAFLMRLRVLAITIDTSLAQNLAGPSLNSEGGILVKRSVIAILLLDESVCFRAKPKHIYKNRGSGGLQAWR